MSEVMNVHVNLANGTSAPGTTVIYGFKAPSDAVGGGITITDVRFCSRMAIAAASAPVFEVVTLGTNAAINGTVTSVLASANWTAGTPRLGTITDGWVDGDEFVGVQWKHTAANADAHIIGCSIQYKMGRG